MGKDRPEAAVVLLHTYTLSPLHVLYLSGQGPNDDAPYLSFRARTIFKACCGVVKDHVETALFLLPHMVLNTLLYGDQADKDEITAEVSSLLLFEVV